MNLEPCPLKKTKEEGRKEGRKEGRREGRKEGRRTTTTCLPNQNQDILFFCFVVVDPDASFLPSFLPSFFLSFFLFFKGGEKNFNEE
jgi:hypothetical protein